MNGQSHVGGSNELPVHRQLDVNGGTVQGEEGRHDRAQPGRLTELERRAHLTMASFGLVQAMVIRHSPRIIRTLCNYAVFALTPYHQVPPFRACFCL